MSKRAPRSRAAALDSARALVNVAREALVQAEDAIDAVRADDAEECDPVPAVPLVTVQGHAHGAGLRRRLVAETRVTPADIRPPRSRRKR